MNRDENSIHCASKCERLLALSIFLLMLMSLFLHLCAFADIFFKNSHLKLNNQTELITNRTRRINSTNDENFLDVNVLPFFCILAHLIWTIVPIVVLDQCCLFNNKSISQIVLKLFICTCPLLLSCELTIIFISHITSIKNDLLFIAIKWLIFVSTILISFWTGILTDKNKWRGIHGGQIAPEFNSPRNLFIN